MATRDWHDWHLPYADPDSPLTRRLRVVQGHIGTWLDGRAARPVTVLSVCAGQGHDLLGVLAGRPDADERFDVAAAIEYAEFADLPDRCRAGRPGVHRFDGTPRRLPADREFFAFVR